MFSRALKRTYAEYGIYYCILRCINHVYDRIWEILQGVDFIKMIPNTDEMFEGTNDCVEYGPSLSSDLSDSLDISRITSQDNILDIGCGKGKVLYILSKYGFGKVDGIEICPGIAEICAKNLLRLKVNKANVFVTDATKFEKYQDYNYYYLYNPFGADTLDKVLSQIDMALQSPEKDVRLIYANPVHSNVFAKHPSWKFIKSLNPTYRRDYSIEIYGYYRNH